jgi:hypothetical protein
MRANALVLGDDKARHDIDRESLSELGVPVGEAATEAEVTEP